MKERLCEDWLWTLNMVFYGMSGVLKKLMGHIGFAFGNSLGGVGGVFEID
jgi:hypothetical protein